MNETRTRNDDSAMTAERTLEIFEQTGAWLRGHFRLTSGLHSPEYLQCALVLQHPEIAAQLGNALARALAGVVDAPVDLVVAPAMGGLIIGHEVARALGVRFIFTERDPGTRQMLLRRGFIVGAGERAVVVEDVITTGGSSREVIDLMNRLGAVTLAAGSVIDRSGGAADLGAPRIALATMSAVTFSEDDCPMCRDGVPVVKPGSRPA
jgi:orotate phosphoribosyltransferase